MSHHFKKVGVVCVCLAMVSAHGGRPPRKSDSRGEPWLAFSDSRLGIAFKYPPQWRAWRRGQDIYLGVKLKTSSGQPPADEHGQPVPTYSQALQVDRALNGRLLSDQDNYAVHLTVGPGDFAHANAVHRIFVMGEDKKPHVAFGRFRNEPAHKRIWGEWRGLDSMILCSTWDQATGFHAAGGWCYWGLISNERQYVLIESQNLGDERTERWMQRIAASIKTVKPSM